MPLHPSDIGQISEAVIMTQCVRRGWAVLLPYGTNHRYDLVIDRAHGFERVQCKTGRYRDGRIIFNAYSHSRGCIEPSRRYAADVDLIAVYCPELDRVYLLPIGQVTTAKPYLRVDPFTTVRQYHTLWAKDFELPAVIA